MKIVARIRHPLVLVGVVLSLFLGVATIRAAALWTAASAPPAARPPSVESLQAALATERVRSATLQAQLDELTSRSDELTAALETARDRIAADAGQADKLRTSLDRARAKLALLEQSIRRSGMARSSTAAPAPTVTSPGTEGEAADDD